MNLTRKYDEINSQLEAIDRRADCVLEGCETALPHHTFSWKYVNFDAVMLAVDTEGNCGFCSVPKYGYKRWQTKAEESANILDICQKMVQNPCDGLVRELREYLQTCRPE